MRLVAVLWAETFNVDADEDAVACLSSCFV